MDLIGTSISDASMAEATVKAAAMVAATLTAVRAVELEGQNRMDWLLKMRHHAPLEAAESSTSPATTLPDRELDHTGKYVYSNRAVERLVSLLVARPVRASFPSIVFLDTYSSRWLAGIGLLSFFSSKEDPTFKL